MDVLLQQVINGLVLGSMYALVALGYTMVYGIINLINFAHGEVLMIGSVVQLVSHRSCCKPLDARHAGLADVADHLDGGGLCGWLPALNYAIEKIAYRPLRNSAQAGPTDHRDWHVHLVANVGHDCVEAQLQTFSCAFLPTTPY